MKIIQFLLLFGTFLSSYSQPNTNCRKLWEQTNTANGISMYNVGFYACIENPTSTIKPSKLSLSNNLEKYASVEKISPNKNNQNLTSNITLVNSNHSNNLSNLLKKINTTDLKNNITKNNTLISATINSFITTTHTPTTTVAPTTTHTPTTTVAPITTVSHTTTVGHTTTVSPTTTVKPTTKVSSTTTISKTNNIVNTTTKIDRLNYNINNSVQSKQLLEENDVSVESQTQQINSLIIVIVIISTLFGVTLCCGLMFCIYKKRKNNLINDNIEKNDIEKNNIEKDNVKDLKFYKNPQWKNRNSWSKVGPKLRSINRFNKAKQKTKENKKKTKQKELTIDIGEKKTKVPTIHTVLNIKEVSTTRKRTPPPKAPSVGPPKLPPPDIAGANLQKVVNKLEKNNLIQAYNHTKKH